MEGRLWLRVGRCRSFVCVVLALLMMTVAVSSTVSAEPGVGWLGGPHNDPSVLYNDSLMPTPDVAEAAGPVSPWPMLQGNGQHTGTSPFIGPSSAALKWRYRTGASVRLGPVIAGDGTVYVASDNGYVHAVLPDGTLWWRTRVGSSLCASPALAADGTLYVGTDEGASSTVCALSSSGRELWRFPLGAPSHTPLTVGSDGSVYAGTDGGYLYAVSAAGKELWRFDTMALSLRPRLDSAAAVGPDGTVYVGSGCGYLHAIAPDGAGRWSIFLSSLSIRTAPTVMSDGSIVCASDAGCLHVVSSGGEVSTICGGSLPYPCEVWSSPALSGEGTIYLGVGTASTGAPWGQGFLGAYKADGQTLWQYSLGGSVRSSPTVGADGTIYLGADDGILYAINPDGTLQWQYATGSAISASPALAADGTLYVASESGYLYALGRPDNRAPVNGTVTPYQGSAPAGDVIRFTTTWTDPDSWADLRACYFVLGANVRPAGNAFLSYDPVANRVYLANDAGTAFLGGLEPGTRAEIANSWVRVLLSETTAVRNGSTVEVTWSVALSAEAPAVKSLYLRCDDRSGHATLWAIRGSWGVR